jgi:pimeloyl-ACP methyl ester carboxylesterase
MAEHLLGIASSATLSWYDDVGHMPFWEAPERFNRELADLAKTARKRGKAA